MILNEEQLAIKNIAGDVAKKSDCSYGCAL